MSKRKTIRYDAANDLYGVLGVPPSATAEDVRRSYRQRAKEVHPDVNPENAVWAHQEFQRLNEAYDILNDPTLRAEYNAVRNRYVAPGDNVPWWDKPHPTSKPRPGNSPYASGATTSSAYTRSTNAATGPASRPKTETSSVPPAQQANDGTTFTRASAAAAHRYGSRGRKKGLRFYHYLFFISMATLVVSLIGTLSQSPASGALLTSTTTAQAQPMWIPLDFNTCTDPRAIIEDPINDSSVPSHFIVRGTAAGTHFLSYSVEMAPMTTLMDDGSAAPNWMVLAAGSGGNHPVIDGLLVPDGIIQGIPPGDYSLRLTVRLDDGNPVPPCEVTFHVARALG